jgi:predicted alpha/beta-fold hydrolase
MFPRFKPRAPWWGGDLQTLRNFIVPEQTDLSAYSRHRLILPLADGSGDRLVAHLNRPAERARRPLVVLVHGLTGCADSRYILASARHFLSLGYPVLRLNLRGAGPSRATCRYQYHAGRSEDLRDALAALDPALRSDGFLVVGFSLGANMLIKYLAEEGTDQGVRAAAAVSAPIDLVEASRRLLEPRNAAYHLYLLTRMKAESTTPPADLTGAERRAVLGARTVLAFDDCFTAPKNGYADAADYYRHTMARRFLPEVAVPTLLIHAADDPWIPASGYRAFDWSSNKHLTLLLAEGGGHVGFHARDDAVPWHNRCIVAHFREMAA